MKKMLIGIFVFLCISIISVAQNKTDLGFDIGWKGDFYTVNDEGNSLIARSAPGVSLGMKLSQELGTKLALESGVYWNEFQSAWRLHEALPASFSGSSLASVQIPLRLKYRVKLYKEKLSISPFIGYRLGVNLDYRSNQPEYYISGTSSFGSASLTDSVSFTIGNYTNYHKFFSLAEAGISLEYRTQRGIKLAITSCYSMGFSNLFKQEIVYRINDLPEQTATNFSKGNNFQVLMGVSYPISNFWMNVNEERTAKERSPKIREESEASVRSRFYIGADVGYTWNHYTNTHPNIVGGDLDFGLFHNRDVISGINFGFNFLEHFTIESGFYYHSFANRYIVKEDGQAKHGGSTTIGGNGFKQIPVNFKYNYRLFKDRLGIVPYIGVSMLTHNVEGVESDSSKFTSGFFDGSEYIVRDSTITVTNAYRLEKSAVLFNAGLGFEYALSKRIILTLYGRYTLGFKDIYHMNLINSENGDTQEGDIYYKGTNLNISVGLKVPIGKL